MKTSLTRLAGAFTSYFMSGLTYWYEDRLCIDEPEGLEREDYGVFTTIEYIGRNRYKVTKISYAPHDEVDEEVFINLLPEQVIMLILVGKRPY